MTNTDMIEVYDTNTKIIEFTITDDGSPYDFTGYTIHFYVKLAKDAAAYLIEVALGAGDIATNVITVELTAAHLAIANQAYWYELRAINAAAPVFAGTIAQGVFDVNKSLYISP